MTVPVRGVVPPMITPLTEERNVDVEALAGLVERLVGAGVDGLFIGGSTGEVALLSDRQRDAALHAAVVAAAGRVPVLAGVIDTGTERVIDHARRAAATGADAVVATPPFYIAPNAGEIAAHYRAVAAAAGVPVIAYAIPSATHVVVPPEVIVELAHDQTIAGFKDSSGDLTTFRAVADRTTDLIGSTFGLFTGSETVADLALAAGGTGIVPGLANVDPDGYVRLQRLAERGDWSAAAREQARLAKLFEIIAVADRSRIGFTAGALGAFKAAMRLRGFLPSAAVGRPLGALTDAEVGRIRDILLAAGLSVADG